MAKLTVSGVCYDLGVSPFFVSRNGYIFYFSTNKHAEDFISQVQNREDWLCDSLSRRFHIKIDARLLADFQLYDRIEKRGFCIENSEGKQWRDVDELVFNGMRIREGCFQTQSGDITEQSIG